MSIPSLGFGTSRLKEQSALDAIHQALSLGYRHIDTAQAYNNEQQVGQALSASGLPRDQVFITTKIWLDNLGSERLIPSLEKSLKKLAMEQVDLTLIHWPPHNDQVPMEEYLAMLLEARAQGLTRQIGVSNFTIDQLGHAIELIGADNIATNQVEIHPFLHNRQLVDFARDHRIHLTAYMPLAMGRVSHDPVLQDIARRHQASAAQIALAWLLQQGLAVIPSSAKHAHQQDNLEAAGIRLEPEDLEAIAGLDRNERIANPDFAPEWD